MRSADFRRVYNEGERYSCPYFAAFLLEIPGQETSNVGFTVPRALGGSVVRNRVKRRVREAVRRRLWQLPPGWGIVFNPRKSVLQAPFENLVREVEKVFAKARAACEPRS